MTIGNISNSVSNVQGNTIEESEIQELKKDTESLSSSISRTKESAEIAKTSTSTSDIQTKIDEIKAKREQNMAKLERIEEEINNLKEQAEDHIIEAAKLQEKAVAEHEEDAKKALDKCISAYIEANKDGKEGMSRAELSSNIAKSMPKAPNIAKALAEYTLACEEIGEIDGLLDNMNSIMLDINSIDIDIKDQESALSSAKAAAESSKSGGCCDPIGFTTDGNNQTRYDFIVDDGNFDSSKDFLGAENQWAAMQALDTDGDGTVTSKELKSGNIKMVKTEADGKQSVVDIAEEFGDDFSVNLKSYKQGGEHNAVDTSSDFDNDGVQDQILLGTFELNIKGETIKGYNTLDDVDYLNEKYNIGGNGEAGLQGELSEDLASHFNFFTTTQAEVKEMDEKVRDGLVNLGVSETYIDEVTKSTKAEGMKKANLFMEKLEEEQKAKEAKEAEESKEAEKDDITIIDEDEYNEDPDEYAKNYADKKGISVDEAKKELQEIMGKPQEEKEIKEIIKED